jgi:hypothetical protein
LGAQATPTRPAETLGACCYRDLRLVPRSQAADFYLHIIGLPGRDMSVPPAQPATTDQAAEDIRPRTAASESLPTYRVNIMRVGYLFMGVGLVLVKWPLFFQNGGLASLPVFEGVVAALLTAMSLLAFLGLRYPIQLLPVLVFESLWKLIWLAAVGVPHLVAGNMDQDPQLKSVFFNVSFVVIIFAVTPWDYVWKRYVRAPGARWR